LTAAHANKAGKIRPLPQSSSLTMLVSASWTEDHSFFAIVNIGFAIFLLTVALFGAAFIRNPGKTGGCEYHNQSRAHSSCKLHARYTFKPDL